MTKDNYQPWARNIADVLKEEVFKKTKAEIHFGFSKWKETFDKMYEAFRECNLALHSRGDGIGFFEEPHLKAYPPVPTDQFLDAVTSEIMQGGKEGIRAEVKRFLECLEEKQYQMEASKVAVLNLLLSVYDRLKGSCGLSALPFSSIQSMQELQCVRRTRNCGEISGMSECISGAFKIEKSTEYVCRRSDALYGKKLSEGSLIG